MSKPKPATSKNESMGRDPCPEPLLSGAVDPAAAFTSDGKVFDLNPPTVEMRKAKSVEGPPGRPLENFFAATSKVWLQKRKGCWQSASRGEFRWSTAAEKDAARDFKFRVAPLPQLRDKADASIIIGQDISQSSTGEAAPIFSTEDYFRSLIDNSFDVTVEFHTGGTIRHESGSRYRIIGYEPEMVGRCRFDIVRPDDIEPVRRAPVSAGIWSGSRARESAL